MSEKPKYKYDIRGFAQYLSDKEKQSPPITKGKDLEVPGALVGSAVGEVQPTPIFNELPKLKVGDFELIRPITGEKKKLYEQGIEQVLENYKANQQQITSGFINTVEGENLDKRLGGAYDVVMGTLGTMFSTFMLPYSFFAPTGRQMGKEAGALIGQEKAGETIGEYLPNLIYPNPLAMTGGMIASELTDKALDSALEDNVSEEWKNRIRQLGSLASFIGGATLVSKGLGKLGETKPTETTKIEPNITEKTEIPDITKTLNELREKYNKEKDPAKRQALGKIISNLVSEENKNLLPKAPIITEPPLTETAKGQLKLRKDDLQNKKIILEDKLSTEKNKENRRKIKEQIRFIDREIEYIDKKISKEAIEEAKIIEEKPVEKQPEQKPLENIIKEEKPLETVKEPEKLETKKEPKKELDNILEAPEKLDNEVRTIEQRVDKSGRTYYWDTINKKRTTKENFEREQNAIQKQSTDEMDVRKPTEGSEALGKGNQERQEIAREETPKEEITAEPQIIEVGEKSPISVEILDKETGQTYKGYGKTHAEAVNVIGEKLGISDIMGRGDRFQLLMEEKPKAEAKTQKENIWDKDKEERKSFLEKIKYKPEYSADYYKIQNGTKLLYPTGERYVVVKIEKPNNIPSNWRYTVKNVDIPSIQHIISAMEVERYYKLAEPYRENKIKIKGNKEEINVLTKNITEAKAEQPKIEINKPEPVQFLEKDLPSKIPKKNEKIDLGEYSGEVNVKPINTKIAPAKDKIEPLKDVVSKDESRGYLTYIFEDANNKSRVATDGHVLVVLEDKTIKENALINPKINQKILKGNEAKFVDYKSIIPATIKERFVPSDDIISELAGINRANKFLKYDGQHIRAKLNVDGTDLYFNSELLLNAYKSLKSAGAKEIRLEFAGRWQDPMVLRDVSNPNNFALVMPLREGNYPYKEIAKIKTKPLELNETNIKTIKDHIIGINNNIKEYKEKLSSEDAKYMRDFYEKRIEELNSEKQKYEKALSKERTKEKSDTIERLRKEALDELNNLTSGFNPKLMVNTIKTGAYYFKQGLNTFAQWSKQMLNDFGQKIKPHLLNIWSEIKKFGKDLAEIGVEKIGQFIESKYNPLRPLKITDEEIYNLGKKYGVKGAEAFKPKEMPREIPKEAERSKFAKEITEEEYKKYNEIRQRSRSFTGKIKNVNDSILKNFKSIVNIYEKLIKSIDRDIESVGKTYFQRLARHDYKTTKLVFERENVYNKFLEQLNKLPEDVLGRLEFAMLNRDTKVIKEIFDKYKIDQSELRRHLNDMAVKSGIEPNEYYFPNAVKDYNKFLEMFDAETRNMFKRLIAEKEAKKGELTDFEKAHIIDNALRGYDRGIRLSKVGSELEKVIKTVDANLSTVYENPIKVLGKYLLELTRRQQDREFFGIGKELQDKSIGQLIVESIQKDDLTLQQAQKLAQRLYDRFEVKPTPKAISTTKKLFYADKLAQFHTALNQLKDLVTTLYETKSTIVAKEMLKVLLGKQKVKIQDIFLEPKSINFEFADANYLSKWLDNVMSKAGFTSMDVFGKKVALNSWLDYAKKYVNKNNYRMEFDLKRYFDEKDIPRIKKELAEGKLTDDTRYYLFSKLARTQPISASSLPPSYYQTTIGKLLWTAKTFMVRRINYLIDEIRTAPNLRTKMYRTLRYSMLAMLLGGSVDTVQNFILGRRVKEEDIEDTLVFNFLDAIGISRFLVDRFTKEGVNEFLTRAMVYMPLPYVDNVYMDIKREIQGKEFKFHTLKSIPVAGRLAWSWFFDKEENKRRRR